FLTTSGRGKGASPTIAASSFDGCSGFMSAGFTFPALAPFPVPLLASAFAICLPPAPFSGPHAAGPAPTSTRSPDPGGLPQAEGTSPKRRTPHGDRPAGHTRQRTRHLHTNRVRKPLRCYGI